MGQLSGPGRGETFEKMVGRAEPRPMRCGLYMWPICAAPQGTRCSDARPGVLPIRLSALLLLNYAVHRAHETAHVFSRAGPGRGPWDVVYCCYCDDFFGCAWVVSTKSSYVRTMHFWQIASGVLYNMTPRIGPRVRLLSFLSRLWLERMLNNLILQSKNTNSQIVWNPKTSTLLTLVQFFIVVKPLPEFVEGVTEIYKFGQ